MSSGVTTTLSVSATGGDPTFMVNGGAEVTSAAVQNGDSIVFKMDAPATGNTSYKMTITAGGMTSYWRVWTGDTTGAKTKKIFPYVYPATQGWGNAGGISNFDSACTTEANGKGLAGSWKAIISGKSESDWAVNRIGYDWTTLTQTDGTPVVMSGNIWSTGTINLLSAPTRNSANTANISVSSVVTGTDSRGKAKSATDSATCATYTNSYSGDWNKAVSRGTSGSTGEPWIDNTSYMACWNHYYETIHIYCIEQ